MNSSHRRR